MRSERIALTYRHTLHTCPYDNSRGARRYLLPLRALVRRPRLPLMVLLDLVFAILYVFLRLLFLRVPKLMAHSLYLK